MLNWLCKVLTSPRFDNSPENYPSVVVLLKEPQVRTPEESVQIVRRALGADTDVELISTLNDGNSHVIRNGKFFFTFHQTSQRYELPGHTPPDIQQNSWAEHRAWIAFDLPTQGSDRLREINSLATAYKLLLVFAFLCWSTNCLIVYFPAEGISVPNLGDLADSINWARRNGQNPNFLDIPKATSS